MKKNLLLLLLASAGTNEILSHGGGGHGSRHSHGRGHDHGRWDHHKWGGEYYDNPYDYNPLYPFTNINTKDQYDALENPGSKKANPISPTKQTDKRTKKQY